MTINILFSLKTENEMQVQKHLGKKRVILDAMLNRLEVGRCRRKKFREWCYCIPISSYSVWMKTTATTTMKSDHTGQMLGARGYNIV